MIKEEFIQEEYEIYSGSIKPIKEAIKKEYGKRVELGYVLLNKDKQPKQCMNSKLIPIKEEQEIKRLNGMRELPEGIIVIGGNKYFKKKKAEFWGKHSVNAIKKVLEKKELGDLNGIGTGKYFVVVDIDTKNINENTPSLEKIESVLPKTLIINTPTGGKHYYFLIKKGSSVPVSTTLPCIDILGKGKLVIAPEQYREGKGLYTYDLNNKNFSYEMASWNEGIRETLSNLFSSKHKLVYLDTQVKSKKNKKSQPKIKSEKAIKNRFVLETVKETLKTGKKIKEGMRNRAVFDYCSLIADNTPANKLFVKAIEFNKKFIENPLPIKEIKEIVKSCIKRFGCYNGKTQPRKKSSTKAHDELNQILLTINKSEEYTNKIEEIIPVIQKFFETKFGKKYSKAIPASEVGKILRNAGFDKKKIQKNGVRAWLWNFNSDSIKTLEAFIAAFIFEKQTINSPKQIHFEQNLTIPTSKLQNLQFFFKNKIEIFNHKIFEEEDIMRVSFLFHSQKNIYNHKLL
jgi:hypothetical protein